MWRRGEAIKNRKQPFAKSTWWRYFGAAGAIVVPLGIVIACGDKATEPPAAPVISVDHTALAKVGVTGDSAHPMFDVPRELIFVNEQNELSKDGNKQVADVFARTLLKPTRPGAVINGNFMPLELLQAYLRGDLAWRGEQLFFTNEAGVEVDVNARYGQLFGFNLVNSQPINYVGVWPANTVEVAYFARPGFMLPASEQGQPVKPNVSELKIFVNLDDSFSASPDAIAAIRAALAYGPNSTHNNVQWTRQLTWQDLPSFWQEAASSFSFFTSDASALSPRLPTAFAYEPTARQLNLQLVAKPNYVLSRASFNLTPYVNLARITTLIDVDPAYIAFRERDALSRYRVRVVNGIVEAEGDEPLPQHVGLRFATSPTAPQWVDGFDFAQILLERENAQPGSVAIYLATVSESVASQSEDATATPYVIRAPIVALAQQPAPLIFASTVDLQAALKAQRVDLTTSTKTSITWQNQLSNLSPYAPAVTSVTYAYGEFANARAAFASGTWSASLPAAPILNAANMNTLRLFARVNVEPAYLVSPLIIDLTTSSQINELVFRLTVEDVTSIANQLDALQPTANSVHTNVTWNNAVTIPEALRQSVLGIEYLTGEYVSYNEALQATEWSTALPRTIDPQHAKRNLWARLITAPGVRISIANYRNLTSSSMIRQVKTAVDALPSYQTYSPNKNVIGQSAGQFTVTINNELPISTKVEWKVYGQNEWIATEALVDALGNLTSLDQVQQTRSRLALTDGERYALIDPREGLARVENVLGVIDLTSYFAQATSLRVDVANSNASDLRWTNITAALAFPSNFVSALDHLEYLIGDFGGSLPPSDATGWELKVPTSFYNGLVAPEMALRVVLKAGYVAVPRNLTVLTTTGLKDVPVTSAVDTAPLDRLLGFIIADKTSTHSNLVWRNTIFTIPAQLRSAIASVEFREGPVPAGTNMASLTGWATTLPTTTDFYPDASTRGLWARYALVPGGPKVKQEYVDLTTSSGILNVPGLVDDTPWYADLDLSKVALRGNYENMILDNDLPSSVPAGITLLFQYQQNGVLSELRSFPDLQAYFKDNYRALQGRINHATFTVQLGLVTRPPKPYVINDNKKISLNARDLFDNPAFDANSFFDQYYSAANISTSGTHDDVKIFLRVANSVPQLNGVEYFVNEVDGLPPALATWSTTLPTTLPFLFSKRYLWVRVLPKFGIELVGGVSMRDITEASGVREIKGRVTALSWYANFSFGGLVLTGTVDDPQIVGVDEIDAFLADYGLYTRIDFQPLIPPRSPTVSSNVASFLSNIRQRRINVREGLLYIRIGVKSEFTPYVEFNESSLSESKRQGFRSELAVESTPPTRKK